MGNQYDRREFLVKPVQWAAAAGLATALPLAAQSSGKVMTRTLGKTGITLPIVSMGVMNADVPGLVRRSYEIGIRHFDTAARYQQGRNETMVGAVIKELGVREKVIIATKVALRGANESPQQAATTFRQTFEESLKRLQMDYVDILYYHMPRAADVLNEEPLKTLQALKKEGKVRHIGVSTHNEQAAVLDAARASGVYEVVLVGFNYTMAKDATLLEALSRASKVGLGLVAMKTQAGGATRPHASLPKFSPAGQTALLKWVLRRPEFATAIPGYTTYEQMEQNFSVASNLDFTSAESDFLAGKATSASLEFCQQCGECVPDCAHNADIPALMRVHMYAVQYANRDHASATLADIAAGRGLDVCQSCDSCTVKCRNSVNVARKIGALKDLTAFA
jgi:aryl-alcohol dehydrogenase-like predicted oxidoreductase